MAQDTASRNTTLDVGRLADLPLGTVLTFRRGDRTESFTWHRNHYAGRSLVRSYLRCGWSLVSAAAPVAVGA